MLDRKLAVRSHYPPIAVLDSVSRLMPAVCSAPHLQKAHELRRLLAAYTASEDLIRIGAYQKGSDPTLDKALALIPELHRFLMQKPSETTSFSDSVAKLLALPS
jgi:flagellar biosynthesis/type III secretory pathway ATPase